MEIKKLDILAFGAHPDDVELSAAGTIISLIRKGYSAGIIDLTEGEMGTRGNKILRRKEAKKSAEVMNLTLRENLKLKDGLLNENSVEAVDKIVQKIRQYKPSIVFANYFVDRHPDHEAAGKLVKKAAFLAGLEKYKPLKNKAHRPKRIFYYMQTYTFEPTFIYNITDSMRKKIEAIACFESQFYDYRSTEPKTFISSANFINYIISKANYFGFLIGAEFGEPFYCEQMIDYNLINLLD